MKMLDLLAQIDISNDEIDIPMTGTPDGTTIDEVLQIAFAVAGSVAFLIIIYAGIQYILSRGEPDKTRKARDTIIYAAIGLGIAVLAFSIVTFVVQEVR